MSVCRRSPRTHFGTPVYAGQLHLDNAGNFSKITADSGGQASATSPGLRYNEITFTWQYSNDGINWLDMGTGGGGGGGSDSGSYKVAEQVSSQISAESLHYLPEGKTFALGEGAYLDVFFNGQLLTHDSGSRDYDYEEVNISAIRFHFDIPAPSFLCYVIRRT